MDISVTSLSTFPRLFLPDGKDMKACVVGYEVYEYMSVDAYIYIYIYIPPLYSITWEMSIAIIHSEDFIEPTSLNTYSSPPSQVRLYPEISYHLPKVLCLRRSTSSDRFHMVVANWQIGILNLQPFDLRC